jgi:hypothetical protein
MREEVMQSVRYAARTPRIVLVLALLLFVSLFVLNFNVVVPLLARDVFAAGAHGYGLLMACLGVGAVLGALGVASAGLRRPSMAMVVVAAIVVSVGVLGLGFVRSFALAGAILVVTGMGQIVFTSSVNSTVQVTVPDAMRGRMMSLYVLVFVGVTPPGPPRVLVRWKLEEAQRLRRGRGRGRPRGPGHLSPHPRLEAGTQPEMEITDAGPGSGRRRGERPPWAPDAHAPASASALGLSPS